MEEHRGVSRTGVRVPALGEGRDELGPSARCASQQPAEIGSVTGASCVSGSRSVHVLDRLLRLRSPTVTIEVREARPQEHAEAGQVTALAYREFVRHGDPDWEDYCTDRQRGEPGRDRGRVRGGRGRAHPGQRDARSSRSASSPTTHRSRRMRRVIRMLGVHPDARRAGRRTLIDACFERARAMGKTRMTLHDPSDEGRADDVRTDGVPKAPRPRVPRRVRAPHLRARDRLRLSRRCPVRTTSPDVRTSHSHSAWTRPPRNCCSYRRAYRPPRSSSSACVPARRCGLGPRRR